MDEPSDTSSRKPGFSRSKELEELALREIPDATSSNYRGKSAFSPSQMIFMKEGEGAMITDVDGNEYVDLHCGVSAIISGHSPQWQIDAVQSQLSRGPYFATAYELEHKTAKLLNDLLPASDLVKFVSTGTEAAMTAIRVARAYTGKEKILKFEGMYHGHSDYLLSNVHPSAVDLKSRRNPTRIPASAGVTDKAMETVETLPWNDIELLQEKLERDGNQIAAVITEGVMSNSGLIRPVSEYLANLQELTEEHNIIFILDEVVTGFRMGLDGAQGLYDISPDLAIFGKALANGYPCAAITGQEDIMRFIKAEPDKGAVMGTFSGNPLVVAATHANLEYLRSLGASGYRDFMDIGEMLVEGLRNITTDSQHHVYVPDFAGFTYLHFYDGTSDPNTWTEWRDVEQHIMPERNKQFANAMLNRGIYLRPGFDRINLTHVHTEEHIETVLEAAKEAIQVIE